ncbi:MAG: hypothetical protein K0R50_3936 [Eubacterium sp.]|nr:hypothetical protein [Eubacterium sp.]
MKIDFYYWNYQCPINYETIMLLREVQADFEINLYDISIEPQLAIDNNIYFPFLTVFNDTIRWRSPLNKSIIKQVKNGEKIIEKPYIIKHSENKFIGEIVELNDSNICLISGRCTLNNSLPGCSKKQKFLSDINNSFYGYLHLDNGKVVGGAEYVPSLQVPYNIPKDEKTAFLTCIYHSSNDFDYKAYPLEKLEIKLSERYDNLITISDELGTFPNGTLEWFLKRGYVDNGVIGIEKDYCKLHLVSKNISHNHNE